MNGYEPCPRSDLSPSRAEHDAHRSVHFIHSDPRTSYPADATSTLHRETARSRTFEHLCTVQEEVARIERMMGITESWTAESQEYKDTLEYIRKRDYILALDRLEQLTVSRMLELEKLNMAGIGMLYL